MKRNLIKTLSALTAAMLAAVSITGCQNDTIPVSEPESYVKLKYYTIGTPDKDLQLVEDAANQILRDKLGIEIEYNKIGWNEYNKNYTALVNTAVNYDIIFTYDKHYNLSAKKGAFLELNDLLTRYPELYNTIDQKLWQAMEINGKIYGVPTNKEVATPEWFVYDKELVDKYDIDITKYTTLESLEPLMELIKQNEPDITPMYLDANAHNFFALDGYEYVIDSTVPLMVKSDDETLKVVNIYETNLALEHLRTLHRYYQNGYINEEAPLNSGNIDNGVRYFWSMSSGGPYSEIIWSKSMGHPVVAQQVSPTIVTNDSCRGSIMAISTKTEHPDECIAFLNLLNTDPELRSLFQYGIEGTHYTRNADGRIHTIPDSGYAGVQYTQGNWFILDLTEEDPADKWDTFRRFNEEAETSHLLGFFFDSSDYDNIIANIREINSYYYPLLTTGCLNPDEYLDDFLRELSDAGIDQLAAAIQRQIDRWMKNK